MSENRSIPSSHIIKPIGGLTEVCTWYQTLIKVNSLNVRHLISVLIIIWPWIIAEEHVHDRAKPLVSYDKNFVNFAARNSLSHRLSRSNVHTNFQTYQFQRFSYHKSRCLRGHDRATCKILLSNSAKLYSKPIWDPISHAHWLTTLDRQSKLFGQLRMVLHKGSAL